MRNWYSRLCCMVKWNGITGAAFPVLCGVRQGGILSSILFAIYVDSLISDLRQSGYGLYIGTLFVWCVVYADDIVLLYVSCFGLQRLVDICGRCHPIWWVRVRVRVRVRICAIQIDIYFTLLYFTKYNFQYCEGLSFWMFENYILAITFISALSLKFEVILNTANFRYI